MTTGPDRRAAFHGGEELGDGTQTTAMVVVMDETEPGRRGNQPSSTFWRRHPFGDQTVFYRLPSLERRNSGAVATDDPWARNALPTQIVHGHTPVRPRWLCARCQKPWPCLVATRELRKVDSPRTRALMGVMLFQAVEDLENTNGDELWNRFLAWLRP